MIIGIDPGQKGGIAVLAGNALLALYPMPVIQEGSKNILDEFRLRKILGEHKTPDTHVFLEKCQSMPGQGVSSTFRYGTGYGILRGICLGLDIRRTLVGPRTWKKTILADTPKDKAAAIQIVHQLFPGVDLRVTPRCRKDSDGLADAVCIAEYGRRLLSPKVSN